MAADLKLLLSDRDKSIMTPSRDLGPLFTRLLILSQESRVVHLYEARDANAFSVPLRQFIEFDSDAHRALVGLDIIPLNAGNSGRDSLQGDFSFDNNLSDLVVWDQHHTSLLSLPELKHTDYAYLFK